MELAGLNHSVGPRSVGAVDAAERVPIGFSKSYRRASVGTHQRQRGRPRNHPLHRRGWGRPEFSEASKREGESGKTPRPSLPNPQAFSLKLSLILILIPPISYLLISNP